MGLGPSWLGCAVLPQKLLLHTLTESGKGCDVALYLRTHLFTQKKNEYVKKEQRGAKKNLRQHSVLDWSPTSILSGPCDACLRGSDETRNVHRGMAADGFLCFFEE